MKPFAKYLVCFHLAFGILQADASFHSHSPLRNKINDRSRLISLNKLVVTITEIENNSTNIQEPSIVSFPKVLHRHAEKWTLEAVPIFIEGPCAGNIYLRLNELRCKPNGREDLAFKFADVTNYIESADEDLDSKIQIGELKFVTDTVQLKAGFTTQTKYTPFQIEYLLNISHPKMNCETNMLGLRPQ